MTPITQPLAPSMTGSEVANLQKALLFMVAKDLFKTFDKSNPRPIGFLEKLVVLVQRELSGSVYGKGTTELVRIFQIQQKLGDKLNGIVETTTAKLMNELLYKMGALNEINDKEYSVSGTVLNSNGVALEGYAIEAYVLTLENDISVGKAITDKIGAYNLSYKNPLTGDPDVEIRTYQLNNPDTIFRSVVKYNASTIEKLDVIVNAEMEKNVSEFTMIVNDAQTHLGNGKLGDLKEDEESSQITYLSNKTGWDGRVVAMLASAHQLGSLLKIDPSHVYALLRAGVPADADSIQSLSITGVKETIANALKQNIITDDAQTDNTLKRLEDLSVSYLLNSKFYASVSSLEELLSLRLNADQKIIFAQTQRQAGDDAEKLWSQLAQKGFTADTISQLQLDGKLGFLTGRNAPLVKRIYDKYNLKNDVDLVSSGLYKQSEWKNIISSDIPAGITADEYSSQMADHVKFSYPTAVAAEMIKRDEVKLGANVSKEELVKFFYSNESKKDIGVQPVKTWEGFGELSTEAKNSAKMFERIYQLTPSDESMTALSKTGLHSAYQIAKYSQNEFVEKLGHGFPNTQEAVRTYKKASEIYSASLGIATTYLTTSAMSNVYSISGRQKKEPHATIAYPTLEELLGNMDYCACDHCKSVLSPAAYLVELLQFIDLEDVASNPMTALKARRPDIENIQLSCENTNMVLPYIDLVNEILEYYIVNGNLTNLKGHDIAESANQSELLAEPQFVNQAAYDELKTKVFPYNLPFHQPLETLRLLFQMWDVTLEKMLSVFSSPLSSRKETLQFNEDEYKTLTDNNFKKLPEFFGEPAENTIAQLNTAIANGKTFSKRVGISYEDLVALLKTNFINPGITLVSLFQKLRISLDALNKFYEGSVTDTQMDAMLPIDIDLAEYTNDIKKWLRNNQQLIMGLVTLTDVGTKVAECNFAEVELRFALPDDTINPLTATTYYKFHRFLRLLRKTGWRIQTLDAVVTTLLPLPSEQITDENIDGVFVQLFDRIANFKKIANHLSYSEKKFPDLLLILDSSNSDSLRKEQCSRILKLSFEEREELSVFTGIDPLANDMEADEPSLIKFIKIAQQLKSASLKIVDLAYLLHHSDMTGNLTPSEDLLLTNIKILRDTLNVIEKENSIAPDNADVNFAKSKMLLVYDAATTNNFFELLLNTKTISAPLVTTEEGLPEKLTVADAIMGFDAFKKEITYAGILSNPVRTAIENATDSLVIGDMGAITTETDLATFKTDFKNAVEQIFTNSNNELNSFATNFPELKLIYDAVINEATIAKQIQKLVELILPELKSRLKLNGLQQALSGILKTDPDIVAVLTGNKEVIKSVADANQTVLYDFIQLEEKIIFDQNKTYRFYLDFPAADDFLLYVAAPQNTLVSLKIKGELIINNVTVGIDEEVKNAITLSLKAGILYPAELTISSLPVSKAAILSWRTKGIEKAIVPGYALYAIERIDFAKTSLTRLSKATQLQNLLKLTGPEVEYFAGENIETKGFLNDLDTDGSISPAKLVAQWNLLELLITFNLIKNENEPEENTWLQVLKNPDAKNSQNKFILEYFNMWQETDLTAVLAHYGATRADISKLSILKKVMAAMETMSSINYPSADVMTWITNDPSYHMIATIKAAVKQKVTEASWLETMQTVSDPVRNLLRDALVNYILQYKKPSPEITNPDKLYEYFLIDVEMDACMKTSRIRMALSTVQLFIQRCLMNLEPEIDPASINSVQWAWMKRYRVWEANRKVFLYPENWLEPELRDEKSSLFKELEGELLQAEVTDESAELAFLNYLKKLDDIAKLDIVGTYLEENEKGKEDDDVLHVIGRTNGNTRQHFYRRYESPGYWTPWEKINLNIEGDHVFPIVWKKRLYLFWLGIFEKPVDVDNSSTPADLSKTPWGNQKKIKVEINICWGEYYKGKWTSPKSTELKKPMIIPNLTSFYSYQLQMYGRKDIVENPVGKFREKLIFYLNYRGNNVPQNNGIFTFTSKNAPPYLEYGDDKILYDQVRNNLLSTFVDPSLFTSFSNTQASGFGRNFIVKVQQSIGYATIEKSNGTRENVLTKNDKLTKGFVLSPTFHPTENQFEAPLFYADEHSTFFIQPIEKITLALRDYKPYYPGSVTLIPQIEIPQLLAKPERGWLPEDLKNPIINDYRNLIKTNENINKVLPNNDVFMFGKTPIDKVGKIFRSFNKKN